MCTDAVLISVAEVYTLPSQTPRTMAAVWYKMLKIQQEEEEDFMKLVPVRALLQRKKRRQHLVGSMCSETAM